MYCSNRCTQRAARERLSGKPPRDAYVTWQCVVCDAPLPKRRSRYCSKECYRRGSDIRRIAPAGVIRQHLERQRPAQSGWLTVYACNSCGTRALTESGCPSCGGTLARVGLGGPCPHCHEPVLLTDLASSGTGLRT